MCVAVVGKNGGGRFPSHLTGKYVPEPLLAQHSDKQAPVLSYRSKV